MKDTFRKQICDAEAKVFVINAYALAESVGLKNKISTIIESAIFSVTSVIPYEQALTCMEKMIASKFSKKGEDVVTANQKAINGVSKHLRLLEVPKVIGTPKEMSFSSVFDAMRYRKGDALTTSAFQEHPDGQFEVGTAGLEKRYISEIAPDWISMNCIQCNQCSLVCPHGVIRPFLLNQKEYEKAPHTIQERAVKAIGMEDYYFLLSASVADCTGCGLCHKVCPGKKGEKAITMDQLDRKEQEVFHYLMENVSPKEEINPYTIKGSQFRQPKFAFSGACAGCGETAYIKLLTQLFGDHLIISNATGCSSIYGASAPSMPYTLPWASSLFEDNAEYGYGMLIANDTIRNRIANIMSKNMDNENGEWFKKWLENPNSYEITKEVYQNLTDNLPEELIPLKDYLIMRNVWCIGGDGWAYDIGFSGIDHVLASNDNIKILVLDSQVYSNTGGQSSKASPKGAIASFASSGKTSNQKDLARIAMSYPQAYVAQVSLGANPQQVIKTFKEANEYPGPAIVIAYTPCISHGIKGGMENSLEMEKLAVSSGFFPTFRRHPVEGFHLDSKKVDFDLYEEFLNMQTRFSMLKVINPEKASSLLEDSKNYSIATYQYYESLAEKTQE